MFNWVFTKQPKIRKNPFQVHSRMPVLDRKPFLIYSEICGIWICECSEPVLFPSQIFRWVDRLSIICRYLPLIISFSGSFSTNTERIRICETIEQCHNQHVVYISAVYFTLRCVPYFIRVWCMQRTVSKFMVKIRPFIYILYKWMSILFDQHLIINYDYLML